MARFRTVIKKDCKIIDAISKMSSSEDNNYIAGVAVIVDNENHVVGVLTDGDIRRGISKGVSIDERVDVIANFRPMTIPYSRIKSEMKAELIRLSRKRDIDYRKFASVVITDESNSLYDVMELSKILVPDISEKIIAVYGMGFVGLTLAATLANEKFLVVGIDTNEEIISNLIKGRPSFYEEGLESLVSSLIKSKQIHFTSDGTDAVDIHIISVGTPIDKNNRPVNTQIVEVAETISKKLKSGNLVIYRSTVPVGTIRNVIIPILETSGLVAGVDFLVSFAPERTVEGNALEELRTLPQIIGGFDHESYEETSRLFSRITNTIVEAETMEAAEMVKLLNNTFRDVVFSFSNEVSRICEELNINAFKLIEAANEGYPRNKIPSPSPGVGGLCLSKDPFLYTNPCIKMNYEPVFGNVSRSINTQGPQNVLNKIHEYCNVTKRNINSLKIYLIGLAFKGVPETSDIRNSVAKHLIELLPRKDMIYIKDHVVSESLINETGCNYIRDIEDGFDGADVVLVMNNHQMNKHFNLSIELERMNKPAMFFDGWNMFNQTEIENKDGIFYATMGYLSKKITYYSVIKLRKDREIFIFEKLLKIDVSSIKDKETIGDDNDLISETGDKCYNWVSGGGTYFINNKYFIIVKRSLESLVNPGEFSLFTGRSDNHSERLNLYGLVRELFEELILYSGDRLLYPRCSKYQNIIDHCYETFEELDYFNTSKYRDMSLEEIHIDDKCIEITSDKIKTEVDLTWHINSSNDINVLFLFKVNVDVKNIHARDAEYHIENANPVYHDRDIYLLDVHSKELICISGNNHQQKGKQYLNTAENTTEHLIYMLNLLEDMVISSKDI